MEAMIALDVKGLTYKYGDGTNALKDVNFKINEGERIGLIGPNGAGKSTLILHLNGILPERKTKESNVRVFELPVIDPNLEKIRSMVGLLFQDPDDQLFCPTVREDVAFGPGQMNLDAQELESRVDEALEVTGLSGYGHRSPHHLSTGEKRRACIAGLLACQPRMLVLDEPTSGLDPRGRRELSALLKNLPITQIVVTHDLEFLVGLCSRVIIMDGGTIVTEGPLESIMSDENLMLAHGLEKPHILRHLHPHRDL